MSADPLYTSIHFGLSDEAWGNYDQRLREAIRSGGFKRIIEVGGGANPSFPREEVAALGLEYTLLDISAEELAKAPAGYHKLCLDIAAPNPGLEQGGYDFAFSRMLAEHVRDGEQLHRNVARLLRAGGQAMHFFPTMWAPPFVANRLLPERAADKLLSWLTPSRDRFRQAKFPAYYNWCRGPSRKQIRRFESLGYSVQAYDGYFGHVQYYQHVPLLRSLHLRWSRHLTSHPVPSLTSFAVLHLQKG